MGVYDIVYIENKKGEQIDLQFKNAPQPSMRVFKIGEHVPWEDGILLCQEGAAVVFGGILVAAFAHEDKRLLDKWNHPLDLTEDGRLVLEHPDFQVISFAKWAEAEGWLLIPADDLIANYMKKKYGK